MYRFAEHEIVIPLIVVTELEAKRTHPELGFFAREALRQLDEMRIEHGRLDLPMKVNDEGGELSVDMSQIDASLLPSAFSLDNDGIILATAKLLSKQGADVYVVSKDLPMRVKASALGLSAEEYRAEFVASSGWTGIADVELSETEVNDLYSNGFIDHDSARQLPCHTGLILTSNKGSALGRITTDKRIKLVRGDIDAFGIHGRSAEQRLALDLLLDDEVGIVSLGGRAGTGKSALAICAGLEHVLERRNHRKVMVFRPLYAVGGQDLGYLPGTEKMSPWAQAVFDTLGAIASPEVIQEIVARDLIEVLPLTHIRGRSLHDSFVIVDEAQSLERNVLLTVLSRIGKGSKVVLTHDVAQRDNLRVGRHDGVVAVVEKLKGHPLFAHVTLTRSERSPIAALVTDLLEDFPV
jgi:PhoH-like ATPase